MYYKRVKITEDGDSEEVVNIVGVHPFRWITTWGMPTDGFTEVDIDMSELREILGDIQHRIDTSHDSSDTHYLKGLWNRISDFINKVESQ